GARPDDSGIESAGEPRVVRSQPRPLVRLGGLSSGPDPSPRDDPPHHARGQRAEGATVPRDQWAGRPSVSLPRRVRDLRDAPGGPRPRCRVRRALGQAPASVVVWSPTAQEHPPRLELPCLTAIIRKHYRPEVRFGRIEVWRRAIGPTTIAPREGKSGDRR